MLVCDLCSRALERQAGKRYGKGGQPGILFYRLTLSTTPRGTAGWALPGMVPQRVANICKVLKLCVWGSWGCMLWSVVVVREKPNTILSLPTPPRPFPFPSKHFRARKDTSDAALSTQCVGLPIHNDTLVHFTTFSLSKDANAHARNGPYKSPTATLLDDLLPLGLPLDFHTWRQARDAADKCCSVLQSPGAFFLSPCVSLLFIQSVDVADHA